MNITFVRGDTYNLKFLLKFKDGTNIIKTDISELLMTVKINAYTDDIIFQKKLDDITFDNEGYCHLIIRPQDTEIIPYGKYIADIEVTLVNGTRKTKVFDIYIQEEVTFHGGDKT